jgi:hypothetical protein
VLLPAITLTLTLLAPTTTTPPPVLIGAAADREWSAQRPSRGVHAASIRAAATIPPNLRPFAQCVSARESSGSYTARNPASSAQGRWQFLDRTWRHGLAHMVTARLRDHGLPKPTARRVLRLLQATPIYRWPGPYQDTGWIEVVQRGGWRHWYLTGSRCNALAPH